jgi:hypothetical protein
VRFGLNPLGSYSPSACGDVKNIFLVDTPSACGGVVHCTFNHLNDVAEIVWIICGVSPLLKIIYRNMSASACRTKAASPTQGTLSNDTICFSDNAVKGSDYIDRRPTKRFRDTYEITSVGPGIVSNPTKLKHYQSLVKLKNMRLLSLQLGTYERNQRKLFVRGRRICDRRRFQVCRVLPLFAV